MILNNNNQGVFLELLVTAKNESSPVFRPHVSPVYSAGLGSRSRNFKNLSSRSRTEIFPTPK